MLQSSDIRKRAMNKWPQFRKHLVSHILFDENDDFFPLKIIGDKTPINAWSKMLDEYSEIISFSKLALRQTIDGFYRGNSIPVNEDLSYSYKREVRQRDATSCFYIRKRYF